MMSDSSGFDTSCSEGSEEEHGEEDMAEPCETKDAPPDTGEGVAEDDEEDESNEEEEEEEDEACLCFGGPVWSDIGIKFSNGQSSFVAKQAAGQ